MSTIFSAQEMQALGAQVAHEIVGAKPIKHARVVALRGELGAGKTTFTQGFLKELGVIESIISPTFLIIRSYPLQLLTHNKQPAKKESHQAYSRAYHIDCYRLNSAKELLHLEFKKVLKNPNHIVLIEWAERVKQHLPKDTRWITIEHASKNTRIVRM